MTGTVNLTNSAWLVMSQTLEENSTDSIASKLYSKCLYPQINIALSPRHRSFFLPKTLQKFQTGQNIRKTNCGVPSSTLCIYSTTPNLILKKHRKSRDRKITKNSKARTSDNGRVAEPMKSQKCGCLNKICTTTPVYMQCEQGKSHKAWKKSYR